MDPQADLLDGQTGPRESEDFVFRHDLAGAAYQQAQDIRRAAAQLDRHTVPLKQARPERERPKRNRIEIQAREAFAARGIF